MSRSLTFAMYFLAIFLQAGAYGLTFMLPRLFAEFGASEKVVGGMLFVTAVATIVTVYFSGHISDKFGRVCALGIACIAIAVSLFLYGYVSSAGIGPLVSSISLGFCWGLTYSLGPIVITRLVSSEERVRFFTLLFIFVTAGFGLSPVFASMLKGSGYPVQRVFYLTSILCVISAILPVIIVCMGPSVFAGMNNFQTVFADDRGLNYATLFFVYTLTVVFFRLVLVKFKGGNNPYLSIAMLQYVMAASVVLFIVIGDSIPLCITVAILFGLGYGASYPILVAMAANDAEEHLGPQTLQIFALTYFIGIFGFPLLVGFGIVEFGYTPVLVFLAIFALRRALSKV